MNGLNGAGRPRGDITTLLDLTTRDSQDDYYTPLNTEETWFTREIERRNRPFVPSIQNFQFRGPAAFGQRFSFDIGSIACGDILFGVLLQIKLGHWLDPTTVLRIQSGRYEYRYPELAWYYANSLGNIIVEKAELEIEDQIIETFDGDFGFVMGRLLTDLNNQVGYNVDGTGFAPFPRIINWPQHRVFPVEGGTICALLPFFFTRTSLKAAFPLIACREGTVRIHITLRNFADCVRIQSGIRANCEDTPLGKTFEFYDNGFPFRPIISVTASRDIPQFGGLQLITYGAYLNGVIRANCEDTPLGKTFEFYDNGFPFRPIISVTASRDIPQFGGLQLITYGAYLNGVIREKMLRNPFEILHRAPQIWRFTEPLKYLVNKTQGDTITVQLPLEANHPMEEIIWFLRRKAGLVQNNEWVNYSNVTTAEYNLIYNPPSPMLVSAEIQINGIPLVTAEESYFRQLISRHHKGGIAGYASYVYGYPFARNPAEHQPSGTLNASRSQSIRLTLTVTPPGGIYNQEWEVVVFVVGLRWLRFENGIGNKMFTD